MNKENNSLGLIVVSMVAVALAVALAVGTVRLSKVSVVQVPEAERLGGLVHNLQEIFSAGIKAGSAETEVINSSGQWVYQVAGTTGTFSGTLTVGDKGYISKTANSTLQIGSTASGVGTGCLILGDSGGATSIPVYITATGGTITATTTKPAICE